ncbi:MAG: hypothetical protein K9M51_03840 [Candidatus Gracilibacteria bacterium]|nr:hypothetical protein [Candidatus Gracilibacteria bacterium]
MNSDPEISQKNRETLLSIVAENTLIEGDEIVLSFIYEQTSNRANQIVFKYQPPQRDDSKKSSHEARLADIKYKKRQRSYDKHFANSIVEKAFLNEPDRNSTDIIGSLKKLSDLLNERPTNCVVSAYYFSDMIEFSDFRKLRFGNDFGKINSYQSAINLGKSDFERIQSHYQLQRGCLNRLHNVTVIFPSKEMDTNLAYSLIPEYWNIIFSGFGVMNINYF